MPIAKCNSKMFFKILVINGLGFILNYLDSKSKYKNEALLFEKESSLGSSPNDQNPQHICHAPL